MSKPTKTQIAVLSAAVIRRDHLLVPPETLKKQSAKALASSICKQGLAAEVQVADEQPSWRTGEDGIRVGLALTAEGRRSIGLEPGLEHAEADQAGSNPSETRVPQMERSAADAPRHGTKQALILGLLRRAPGASLDELVAATGWLPHTTRASLTGLRQRGFAIERRKGADGRSVYLIPNPDGLASEAA